MGETLSGLEPEIQEYSIFDAFDKNLECTARL